MNMSYQKDFLSNADWTPEQYMDVLKLAMDLKHSRPVHEPVLAGQTWGVYTTKPSLRTRLSFETAISELGGNSLFIREDEIGLGVRESHHDVGHVISRMLGGFIVRSNDQAGLLELAEHTTIPIINALTDKEHPCQAVADVLTIYEYFGRLKGVKLAYIGDGNNVTNSLMLISAILGIEFTAICPPTYEPENHYLDLAMKLANKYNNPYPVVTNDALLARTVDVLYTDVWVSMGADRMPTEQMFDIYGAYQINEDMLSGTDVKVMHCLPAHRGEEITANAFEANKKLIFDQAENRLHAQKAIIYKLANNCN